MKKIQELTRLNYKQMKLQHLRRKVMTISNIMFIIAEIMKKHKGIENAISGDELFKNVYLTDRKPDYVDDFRWDYIRKAMHRLRQRTKLFIANTRHENGSYYYFVPTNEEEAQHYINFLENSIKRMRSMQRKAMKSVYERWYELDWIEENKYLKDYKELFSAESKKIGQKKFNK